jgi:hypothetical protein
MMMHISIDADEAKELMALAGVLGQLGVPLYTEPL